MKCYNCGSEVSLGQRRCPNCGLVQPTAAVPNIPRVSSRGRGTFSDVERVVTRSKFPTWAWIVIALIVVLIAVCGCIAVGIFLFTTGSLPFDLPFDIPFDLPFSF